MPCWQRRRNCLALGLQRHDVLGVTIYYVYFVYVYRICDRNSSVFIQSSSVFIRQSSFRLRQSSFISLHSEELLWRGLILVSRSIVTSRKIVLL